MVYYVFSFRLLAVNVGFVENLNESYREGTDLNWLEIQKVDFNNKNTKKSSGKIGPVPGKIRQDSPPPERLGLKILLMN